MLAIDGALTWIIERERAQRVGVGFLVGAKEVLTAAHVVNAALGRHKTEILAPEPNDYLSLEFVSNDDVAAVTRTARIRAWLPADPSRFEARDVALLELDRDVDVRPLSLSSDPGIQSVRMFGPTHARPNGVYADADLMGITGDARVQVDGRFRGINRPGPGWSGSPMWDPITGVVFGMLTAVPRDEEAVDLYGIPTRTLVGAWPQLIEPALVPTNPYRGLAPYNENDRALYFGRGGDVARFVAAVDAHVLTGVVGPSGIGKTSLLRAGVLPALRDRRWLADIVRPGDQPIHSLAGALSRMSSVAGSTVARTVDEWGDLVRRGGLVEAMWRLTTESGSDRVVLLIDQYEEVLAVGGETDADRLQQMLSDVASQPDRSPIRVVISIRDDWWGSLVCADDVLGDVIQKQTWPMRPMKPADLRDVIMRPAQANEVTIDDDLVDVLVRDVEAEPGNLPMLSLTLQRLWGQQVERRLSLSSYASVGEVTGALTRYAEEVFAGLTHEEQFVTRRVLTLMVVPGLSDTRRRLLKSDIHSEDWPVVEKLVRARLLVAGRGDGDHETVEPAHEALIRSWPRLREWLVEDSQFLGWLDRTWRRKQEWEEFERSPALLLAAPLLSEAQTWLERRPESCESLKTFIAEGVRHTHVLRRADERYRQRLARAQGLAQAAQADLSTVRARALAVKSVQTLPTREGDRALRHALLRTEVWRYRALEPVRYLALSDDGSTLALAVGQDVHIVDLGVGKIVRTLGHDRPVGALALSRSGSIALTSTWESIHVWNATSGDLRHRLGPVSVAALSGDETMLAIGAPDGTASLLALGSDTLVPVASLVHETKPGFRAGATGANIRAIAVDVTGSTMVSASAAGTWVLNHGGSRRRLDVGDRPINRLSITDDGSLLVASDDGRSFVHSLVPDGPFDVSPIERGALVARDGSVICGVSRDGSILVVARNQPPRKLTSTAGFALEALAESGPDAARALLVPLRKEEVADEGGRAAKDHLAVLRRPGSISLCSVGTGRERSSFSHRGAIGPVATNWPATLVALALGDGTVNVREELGPPWLADVDLRGKVMNLAFVQGGPALLSASIDGHIAVKRLGAEEPRRLSLDVPLTAVVVDSQRRRMVAGCGDGKAVLLDVGSFAHLARIVHDGAVTGTAYSPNGELFASCSVDGATKVWDAAGTDVAVFMNDSPVTAMVFSGATLIIARSDGDLLVHDLSRGGTHTSSTGVTLSALVPLGNSRLAAASPGGTVRILASDSFAELARFTLDSQVVWLYPSSKGSTLVASSDDGTISTIDWSELEETNRIHRSGSASVVAMHPDGTEIAIGTGAAVEVVEARTGVTLVELPSNGRVTAVTYNEDGRLLGFARTGAARVEIRSPDLLVEYATRRSALRPLEA